MMIPDFSDDTL